MVDPQRQLDPAGELPDRVPTGFAELSSEVLGHTDGGEQETLQVGRVEEGAGDPAAALFVVVDEEKRYSFQVFPRKASESRLARDVTRCFVSSQLTVGDDGLVVAGPALRPL
jgi:hypothetical protein